MVLDKHNHTNQPIYYQNKEKIKSRKKIIEFFREKTGMYSIPKDRGYWTLCRDQPNNSGSEIVQLVNMGFIEKYQFFGVDYDNEGKGFIESNRKSHPEANWFKGDWLDVLRTNYEIFKPKLIFFDYIRSVESGYSHDYLAKTMNMCPSDTFIAANFMISSAWKDKYDPKCLIKGLEHRLRKGIKWRNSIEYYSYKCSKTIMGIFYFWQEKLKNVA